MHRGLAKVKEVLVRLKNHSLANRILSPAYLFFCVDSFIFGDKARGKRGRHVEVAPSPTTLVFGRDKAGEGKARAKPDQNRKEREKGKEKGSRKIAFYVSNLTKRDSYFNK